MNIQNIIGAIAEIVGGLVGIYAIARLANKRRQAGDAATYWSAVALLTISYVVVLLTLARNFEHVADIASSVFIVIALLLILSFPKREKKE